MHGEKKYLTVLCIRAVWSVFVANIVHRNEIRNDINYDWSECPDA